MRLFKANKKLLSLDFGSSGINAVVGQATKDSINILKSTSIQLPQGLYEDGRIIDGDTLSSIISDTLKKDKVNRDLQGIGIVNSSSIITREVSIPKVATNEINPLIGYQVSEFLPVNPDDYVVNHLIIGTTIDDGVEKYRTILIAIPKGIVLSHLDLMKESGLKPEVLDFQANSMAKLLKFNTEINESYSIKDKTIACVDMGHVNTDMTIVKDGNIEVTRTFEVGGGSVYKGISDLFGMSIDEASEKIRAIENINDTNDEFDDYSRVLNLTRTSLNALMENVQSVVRYYTSRATSNRIDLILIQGGCSHLNGICEMFTEYLDIECVKLQSLDKVKFDGDLSLYANAIGGIIRREEVKR